MKRTLLLFLFGGIAFGAIACQTPTRDENIQVKLGPIKPVPKPSGGELPIYPYTPDGHTTVYGIGEGTLAMY